MGGGTLKRMLFNSLVCFTYRCCSKMFPSSRRLSSSSSCGGDNILLTFTSDFLAGNLGVNQEGYV